MIEKNAPQELVSFPFERSPQVIKLLAGSNEPAASHLKDTKQIKQSLKSAETRNKNGVNVQFPDFLLNRGKMSPIQCRIARLAGPNIPTMKPNAEKDRLLKRTIQEIQETASPKSSTVETRPKSWRGFQHCSIGRHLEAPTHPYNGGRGSLMAWS